MGQHLLRRFRKSLCISKTKKGVDKIIQISTPKALETMDKVYTYVKGVTGSIFVAMHAKDFEAKIPRRI